jgi:Tfp pilus assembly protein PilW
MKRTSNAALTLIELIVALVITAMVMVGIYNIQLFSHYHVMSATRKSALQNEATYLLSHISGQIRKAVSDGSTHPVDFDPSGSRIRIWTDTNPSPPDGQLQASGAPRDTLVYYNHAASGTVTFCPDADISAYPGGTVSCSGAVETLASHISSNFNSTYVTIQDTTNYIDVTVTACWDPATPATCGSLRNPSVTLISRLCMPAASSLQ